MAFSPDGRRIVSGSSDNTLRLWDAATGKPIGPPLLGHTSRVWSVAFSPDGRRIVSGSFDNTLRIWDAATGKPIGAPLQGHTDSVRSVAISPDGRRIVSGSFDNTLRLWDAASGKPIGPSLQGHSGWVNSVAFSPDGRRIVSGSGDNTLRLWDAATGKPIGPPLQGHTEWVQSVAFSPDGRRIVSGSNDKTLRIWDARTDTVRVVMLQPVGKPIATGQGGVPKLIQLKNEEVISAGYDATLRRWREGKAVGDGKPIATGDFSVLSLVELRNGELISGGSDGSLRRWRQWKAVGDAKPIPTGQGGVRILIELKNGELISGGFDGTLRRWRDGKPAGNGKPINTGQQDIVDLIELKDGELISSGLDGTLRRWRDGKPVGDGKPVATNDGPLRLIQLENGDVISGGTSGMLKRWRDGKVVGNGEPIPTGQFPLWSLIVLKNGEVISGGGSHELGTLRRWRDGKPVGNGQPIATRQGAIISLIQLKNGELISGGHDGTLRRWRTTPTWHTLLPLACAKLEHHYTLTSQPWLNTAGTTCEHFVWSRRPRFGSMVVSLLPVVWATALGVSGVAAVMWLARRRREGLTPLTTIQDEILGSLAIERRPPADGVPRQPTPRAKTTTLYPQPLPFPPIPSKAITNGLQRLRDGWQLLSGKTEIAGRYALLIGISSYGEGLSPIASAMKDVEAMKDVLLDPDLGGFAEERLQVLSNPGRMEMEIAIESFFANKEQDDLLVLYFSGLGFRHVDRQLLLSTSESKKVTRDGRSAIHQPTTLSARDVLGYMDGSRARRQVVILDCAFSGAFAHGMEIKPDKGMFAGGIKEKQQKRELAIEESLGGNGRAVLMSSHALEISEAVEEEDGLSVYTHFLVEGIRTGSADGEGKGWLNPRDLHRYAAQRMADSAPTMTPQFIHTEEGDCIRFCSVSRGPSEAYRSKVQELAEKRDGVISVVGRAILDHLRQDLGLEAAGAKRIEAEVLQTFLDYEPRLTRYRATLAAILETRGKQTEQLTPQDREELQELEKQLNLRGADVAAIKAEFGLR